MTAKPIHSMIRVLDENRSVAFYRTAFGLEPYDRYAFDSFTLIYLRNATSTLEVERTGNQGRTEPYSLGDGYGHLAGAVDDLEAEHARFEAEGLRPRKIFQMEREGELIARFFFVEDPDGYKIEVLQRRGRFK